MVRMCRVRHSSRGFSYLRYHLGGPRCQVGDDRIDNRRNRAVDIDNDRILARVWRRGHRAVGQLASWRRLPRGAGNLHRRIPSLAARPRPRRRSICPSRRRPSRRPRRLLAAVASKGSWLPGRSDPHRASCWQVHSPAFRLAAQPAPSAAARVERIAQTVAKQVERQHQGEDRQTRPHRHPRRLRDEVFGRVQHAAPGRIGWLLAEAQKR
jgi:hypothetical protein